MINFVLSKNLNLVCIVFVVYLSNILSIRYEKERRNICLAGEFKKNKIKNDAKKQKAMTIPFTETHKKKRLINKSNSMQLFIISLQHLFLASSKKKQCIKFCRKNIYQSVFLHNYNCVLFTDASSKLDFLNLVSSCFGCISSTLSSCSIIEFS